MHILVITLIAHVLFTISNAYWLVPWLDMPVHFLIGAGLALVFVDTFKMSKSAAIVSVIVLALGWEYVERIIGFSQALSETFHDAATDIAFGVIGGIIGSVYKKDAK